MTKYTQTYKLPGLSRCNKLLEVNEIKHNTFCIICFTKIRSYSDEKHKNNYVFTSSDLPADSFFTKIPTIESTRKRITMSPVKSLV